MIAANKRFLKANLTQGVLEIQSNLVELYAENLEALTVQAALIGGFSFTALIIDYTDGSTESESFGFRVLTFFFYTCFSIAFATALYVLCVGTMAKMFGPTLALKGSTDDAVKYAATQMRKFQMKAFKAAFAAITALFVGSTLVSWAIYQRGVAIITMFVYFAIYLVLVSYGYSAYRKFNPNIDGAFLEPDAVGYHADGRKMSTKEYKEELERKEKERIQDALEATKLKVKAPLWKRQAIEHGGLFVKYFAVLEKGRLDLYRNEKEYRDNCNPLNSKPVKLWQYNLELDHRKYQQNVTSITSSLVSSLAGSEDFALTDLMKSEYDLKNAARNFKFGLVPKVVSELVASTTHEFLAHDEATYRLWVESFESVVSAFDEIAANPSVEHTIRVGTADVELVVQAANNNASQ